HSYRRCIAGLLGACRANGGGADEDLSGGAELASPLDGSRTPATTQYFRGQLTDLTWAPNVFSALSARAHGTQQRPDVYLLHRTRGEATAAIDGEVIDQVLDSGASPVCGIRARPDSVGPSRCTAHESPGFEGHAHVTHIPGEAGRSCGTAVGARSPAVKRSNSAPETRGDEGRRQGRSLATGTHVRNAVVTSGKPFARGPGQDPARRGWARQGPRPDGRLPRAHRRCSESPDVSLTEYSAGAREDASSDAPTTLALWPAPRNAARARRQLTPLLQGSRGTTLPLTPLFFADSLEAHVTLRKQVGDINMLVGVAAVDGPGDAGASPIVRPGSWANLRPRSSDRSWPRPRAPEAASGGSPAQTSPSTLPPAQISLKTEAERRGPETSLFATIGHTDGDLVRCANGAVDCDEIRPSRGLQ
ncbi:hypothetical protein HPB47_007671, partial [Ixodes persulcatus]